MNRVGPSVLCDAINVATEFMVRRNRVSLSVSRHDLR
jgi:hypothetical protein